jgi:hypothetical protein
LPINILVEIVRRPHDAFQCVATSAIEQRGLFLLRAGDTHHPLGICELTCKIVRLLELDVGRGGLLSFHHCLGRGIDPIANRADADRIFAREQAGLREGVASLRVGCHAHPDDGTRLCGCDDDTFHIAFSFGADGAGQRRLILRPNWFIWENQQQCRGTGGERQHQFASHGFHPDERCLAGLNARL